MGNYIVDESSRRDDDLPCDPWLPEGFEFLSGLPEPRRQKRPLLTIQAYIDDSGVKGTDAVFVLAGFITTAMKWAEFTTEWDSFCRQSPSISYLKMYEVDRSTGQFRGWDRTEIDKKLRGFVDIIKRHAHKAIHVTVDLDAHARLFTEKPSKDVYYYAFFAILAGVCFDAIDEGLSGSIEVIFDEHVIFGPRVAFWYPAIRESLSLQQEADYRELARVLPAYPIFKKDQEFPPLQAADILAWLFRQAFSGKRNGFEWIAEELQPSIPMSQYATVLDEKRMTHQLELSRNLGWPSRELLDKWRKILRLKSVGEES